MNKHISPKSIKDLNVTMFKTLLQTLIDPTTDTAGKLQYIRQAKEIIMIDNNLLQLDQYAHNTHYFAYQINKIYHELFNELRYTEPNFLAQQISIVYDKSFMLAEMGYKNAINIQLPPKTPAGNE